MEMAVQVRKWDGNLVSRLFTSIIIITLVLTGILSLLQGFDILGVAGLLIYSLIIASISVVFGLDKRRKPRWVLFANSILILSSLQLVFISLVARAPSTIGELLFLITSLFIQNLIFGYLTIKLCKK